MLSFAHYFQHFSLRESVFWQIPQTVEKIRRHSWGMHEGVQPLHIESYRPALPVVQGDFSERQRRKIISAALPCRMKHFILHGACQKLRF